MTGLGREASDIATDRHLKMDLGDSPAASPGPSDGCAPFMWSGPPARLRRRHRPVPELARSAAPRALVHVDAAWGGAAIISPRLKAHLAASTPPIRSRATRTMFSVRWRRNVLCRHPDASARLPRGDLVHAGKTSGPPTTRTRRPCSGPGGHWSEALLASRSTANRYVEMIEHSAHGDVLRDALQVPGGASSTRRRAARVLHRDGLDTGKF